MSAAWPGWLSVGDAMVRLVSAGQFRTDAGATFGIVPRTLWSQTGVATDESGRLALEAWCVVIRRGKQTICVDAGPGRKLGERGPKFHSISLDGPDVAASLRSVGVEPDSVTHFVYSHLHFDHAGGSTLPCDSDSSLRLLFPNARHFVGADQLAWARNPSMKDQASYLPENWEPVADASLLESVPCHPTPLADTSLHASWSNGHTAGMMMLELEGRISWHRDGGGAPVPLAGEGVRFVFDLVPLVHHVRAQWVPAYDNFPLTTIAERQRVFTECRNTLIVLGHETETPLIRVVRENPHDPRDRARFIAEAIDLRHRDA